MSDLSNTLTQRWQESRYLATIFWTFFGLFLGIWFCLHALEKLTFNEQKAIHRIQSFQEGENLVGSTYKNQQVERNDDNKLVHVSGEVTTAEVLRDILFDVEVVNVLQLRRVVEMYQWEEVHSIDEYGTSHYAHYRVWKPYLIDSKQFHWANAYQNPTTMPLNGQTLIAPQITIGEFRLSPNFVNKINNFEAFSIASYSSFWQVQANLRHVLPEKELMLDKLGNYYIGATPEQPQLGDVRIHFEIVRAQPVSIIAQQVNSQLVPYQTQNNDKLELFSYGHVSAKKMFLTAKINLFLNTLPARFWSLVFFFLGIYLIFSVAWLQQNPLPILGHPSQMIGWLTSLFIATALTFALIALAWIDLKPILGGILLIIAAIFLYCLKYAHRKPPEFELITENVVPEK
jgi:hypothetical protein